MSYDIFPDGHFPFRIGVVVVGDRINRSIIATSRLANCHRCRDMGPVLPAPRFYAWPSEIVSPTFITRSSASASRCFSCRANASGVPVKIGKVP